MPILNTLRQPLPGFPPVPALPKSPMEHQLAALLLTPIVQGIDLRYGHVGIMPAGYRMVAEALFQGRISIEVKPEELKQHQLKGGTPLGMYDAKTNRIVVPRHDMMETEKGRVTLVHEAGHAIQDRKVQVISSVQSEGAVQAAEVWFMLESGISTHKKEPDRSRGRRGDARAPVFRQAGDSDAERDLPDELRGDDRGRDRRRRLDQRRVLSFQRAPRVRAPCRGSRRSCQGSPSWSAISVPDRREARGLWS